MTVGILYLELHLPFAQSLKDKRSILKSLKDRLHDTFHVAVAERDASVKWQRASLGVASIGEDRVAMERGFQQMMAWLDANRFVEVVRAEHEWR